MQEQCILELAAPMDPATEEWKADFETPRRSVFFKAPSPPLSAHEAGCPLDEPTRDWLSSQEFPILALCDDSNAIACKRDPVVVLPTRTRPQPKQEKQLKIAVQEVRHYLGGASGVIKQRIIGTAPQALGVPVPEFQVAGGHCESYFGAEN